MSADEAPHVFILGEGGTVFKMDLPLPEGVQDRMDKGYIRQVNEDGSAYEGDDGISPPPTEAPAASARKADWVAWAVVTGMDPDDAEAYTKTDLVELTGHKKAKKS